ncbi:TCP-1/cpn60 chaperonin family protein [Halorubrum ezzemoulense]|uniref:TCP-1/cpn60 chaperonin family protein n=2 Tax=Halorubrum ezzemoulense TaxID=337243 RepID=UPI003F6E41CA
MAEIGGLSLSEIQEQLDVNDTDTEGLKRQLGSVQFHISEGHLGDHETPFIEIIGLKEQLINFRENLLPTIKKQYISLDPESFETQVQSYVEKSIAADKQMGFRVDVADKWFYRTKHRLYLDHVYDTEHSTVEWSADSSRPYRRLYSRLTSESVPRPSDFGHDIVTGNVINMVAAGVIEPLSLKQSALDTATEAAVMILRIDDVISSGDLKSSGSDGGNEGRPDGAFGGVGGMGSMGGTM